MLKNKVFKTAILLVFVLGLIYASNLGGNLQVSKKVKHPSSPLSVNGNLYDLSINYAKRPDSKGFLIQLSPYNDFVTGANNERGRFKKTYTGFAQIY
jgi:hypothetical protein